MQWMLHGAELPDVAQALRARGDTVHIAAEAGLAADAPALDVLDAARKKQWDILTVDRALPEALFESRRRFAQCIVYLQSVEEGGIERLFERYRRLTPGRLYTVTGSRVKIRQLPGKFGSFDRAQDRPASDAQDGGGLVKEI